MTWVVASRCSACFRPKPAETRPSDDRHGRRYSPTVHCRLLNRNPLRVAPMRSMTSRRPQVTVRSRLSTQFLVVHSRTTGPWIPQSRRIAQWPKVTTRDQATRRSRWPSLRAARAPYLQSWVVALPRHRADADQSTRKGQSRAARGDRLALARSAARGGLSLAGPRPGSAGDSASVGSRGSQDDAAVSERDGRGTAEDHAAEALEP
jgi:hypothetical protein